MSDKRKQRDIQDKSKVDNSEFFFANIRRPQWGRCIFASSFVASENSKNS